MWDHIKSAISRGKTGVEVITTTANAASTPMQKESVQNVYDMLNNNEYHVILYHKLNTLSISWD